MKVTFEDFRYEGRYVERLEISSPNDEELSLDVIMKTLDIFIEDEKEKERLEN